MAAVCTKFNIASEMLLLFYLLREIWLLSLLYPDPSSFYWLSVFVNDKWNIHKPFEWTMV